MRVEIEILETVLIQAYCPDFQRHHINQTAAYLKKLGYTQPDGLMLLPRDDPGLASILLTVC